MTIDKLNELRTSQEHSRSWKLYIIILFLFYFNFYWIDVPLYFLPIYIYDFYLYFLLMNITTILFILTTLFLNILTL